MRFLCLRKHPDRPSEILSVVCVEKIDSFGVDYKGDSKSLVVRAAGHTHLVPDRTVNMLTDAIRRALKSEPGSMTFFKGDEL